MNKNATAETERKSFRIWLEEEEHSRGTIEKYIRDVNQYCKWLNGGEMTKESVMEWKESLLDRGYKASTINAMIASLNAYCRYLKLPYKIRSLRIQRRLFRDERKELSRAEYNRLTLTALKTGKNRTAMLIEAIGSTGIRVSEVKHITVEAALCERAQISMKGKIRVIMLPHKLCRKLLQYAKTQNITTGEIFLTKTGKGITRKQIWAEMKKICKEAGVSDQKVFPHNLRHLFAMEYYKTTHDVVLLSDVLGHSSIETTRIYLISSGNEIAKQLENMKLVM